MVIRKLLALGAFMAVVSVAASANAAECKIIAAAGDGPTQGIAEVMSTNGLKNIIENKGLKGQGPVKTKCEAGVIFTECRSQQRACK